MTEIIDVSTKVKFQIHPKKSGENSLPCPACSDLHPKNSKRKCFSWNEQKKAGFCHRCEAHFVEDKPFEKKENYILPAVEVKTGLSKEHLKYFHGRMISSEALQTAGVYSSTRFMPQLKTKSAVVAFPFYRDGILVNVKYRGPKKSFALEKGAEKIFYNWDMAKHTPSVVIVEGEIDALSYITCGIKFVISVPNGAGKNLDYMNDCVEFFEEKEEVYLAVDNDKKGLELRLELVRRIGAEKCKIVDFGKCKDANEYLVKYGAPELFGTLGRAPDYPVSGIFTVADFKDEFYQLWKDGPNPGLGIGIHAIDERVRWEVGRLAILTGIPSHGKSTYLDFVLAKMNHLHGWRAAIFSPESMPLAMHARRIASKFFGSHFAASNCTMDEFNTVTEHIEKNFFFVAPEDGYTAENILAKAKYLVKKQGIRILVIDPYNSLEHDMGRDNETHYIGWFLDKLRYFAQRNKVLVALVAHPTKMQKDAKGRHHVPNLYSIAGSSNFFNKTDFGLTVYRKADEENMSNIIELYIQKVRFDNLGKPGKVDLMYNPQNGRFEAESISGVGGWDNSNWLKKEGVTDAAGEVPF